VREGMEATKVNYTPTAVPGPPTGWLFGYFGNSGCLIRVFQAER
jgi:hypothetical protein